MRAYEAHKRSWGLVDFVDQDRLMLELLGNRDLEIQLRERIESGFVDEFQDTSPLQLANFVAISRIARSSVWVGDPKQAIYGFRGTDPDLITHVAPKIQEAAGGTRSTLDKNWRSRPGLVAFFNDAFGPTFHAMGLPPEATRIAKVERDDLPGQATPLAVGRIEREFAASVASGVVDALAEGTEWRVARDSMAEPLAPGDIAIPCRTNGECLGIADALATAGMKVAIERGGLFGTLEARLAIAALRWCAAGETLWRSRNSRISCTKVAASRHGSKPACETIGLKPSRLSSRSPRICAPSRTTASTRRLSSSWTRFSHSVASPSRY